MNKKTIEAALELIKGADIHIRFAGIDKDFVLNLAASDIEFDISSVFDNQDKLEIPAPKKKRATKKRRTRKYRRRK
jgi:hypothetical protein